MDDTSTFEPFDDPRTEEEPLETCATCGARLGEPGRWYPTCAHQEQDELAVFAFCDEACKREFREP